MAGVCGGSSGGGSGELQGGPDAKEPHNNGFVQPRTRPIGIEFKTDRVIDCSSSRPQPRPCPMSESPSPNYWGSVSLREDVKKPPSR